MSKYLEPDTDVYDPQKVVNHPWADMFRDIPRKWEKVPNPKGADGYVFQPAGPGTITLPTTPGDLARHVQLCGFVLDEDKARVQRIDPVRGGRSFTSPGTWQDKALPIPEGNPVHAVVQTAVAAGMTAAELRQTAEQLAAAAEARSQ